MHTLHDYIESLKANRTLRRKWQRAMGGAGALVLVVTLFALGIPAFTLGDKGDLAVVGINSEALVGEDVDTSESPDIAPNNANQLDGASAQALESEPLPYVLEGTRPNSILRNDPFAAIAVENGLKRASLKSMPNSTAPGNAAKTSGTMTIEDVEVKVNGNNGDITLKNPAIENDTFVRWTGEYASAQIAISNTNAQTSGDTIRLYVKFDKGDGRTGEIILPAFTGYGNPITIESDAGTYTYYLKQSDTEGVYYFECPKPTGGTQNINFQMVYPTATSEGGYAKLWVAELNSAQNAAAGNSVILPGASGYRTSSTYQEVKWDSKPDTFPVSKRSQGSPSFVHEGGNTYVSGIGYEVRMERTVVSPTSVGQDFMQRVEFDDTLVLPPGTQWRAGLVDAIRNGNWRVGPDWRYLENGRRSYSGFGAWVTIGGVEYKFAEFNYYTAFDYSFQYTSQGYEEVPVISLSVDSDGNPVAHWQFTNETLPNATGYPTKDIKINNQNNYRGYSPTITYGDRVVVANDIALGQEYVFTNNVTATEDFSFADDVVQTRQATVKAVVTEGRLSSKKTHGDISELRFGDPVTFTISVNNPGALTVPLDSITDEVPTMYVLTPAQMAAVLCDSSYGNEASITIDNAWLCEHAHASNSVTTADGGSGTPTAQLVSPATTYRATSTDVGAGADNCPTTKGKLRLKWAGNTLQLVSVAETQGGEEVETTLDSLSSGVDNAAAVQTWITNSLNDMQGKSFTVGSDTQYTIVWNTPGGVLYGGNATSREFTATVKDTFQLVAGDTLMSYPSAQVQSTNSAKVKSGSNISTVSDSQVTAVRDFTIDKAVTMDGQEVTVSDSITKGKVLDYTLKVTRDGGTAVYEALPLVDAIDGAQLLLVPMTTDNSHLAEKGLSTHEIEGEQFYVLDRPGTYANVHFSGTVATSAGEAEADFIAAQIIVGSNTAQKIDQTLIKWYLNSEQYPHKSTIEIPYKTIVDPNKAVDVQRNAGSGDSYAVNNVGYLGDHEGHRIYKPTVLVGSRVGADKKIVTDRGASPAEDTLSVIEPVSEGQTVTYRLNINYSPARDEALVITGSEMRDSLPLSIPQDVWENVDVAVEYPAQDGVAFKMGGVAFNGTNNATWRLSNTAGGVSGPIEGNQQYILWDEGFSIELAKDAYIYVKLTFPSQDNWNDYAKAYAKDRLANTFEVREFSSTVFHYLDVDANAVLKKGVVETGVGRTYSTNTGNGWADRMRRSADQSEGGRVFYTNATTNQGYVNYYVVLYNDGLSRLYLNDMKDTLPKGFTFLQGESSTGRPLAYENVIFDDPQAMYEWKADGAASLPYTISDSNNANPVAKTASVTAIVTQSDPQQVVFKLSNAMPEGVSGEGDLNYDNNRKKYYLAPGEYVGFCYSVLTNQYADTLDRALNSVNMEYDSYNGGKVVVDPDTTIESVEFGECPKNDGDSVVTDSGDKQYLSSSVIVGRQPIAPGVSKKVVSKTDVSGTVTNNPEYVGYQDKISWEVVAENASTTALSEFVLSDEIDWPYRFTGPIGITIHEPVSETVFTTYECPSILSFESWVGEPGAETAATVSYQKRNYANASGADRTLTVDGEPITVRMRVAKTVQSGGSVSTGTSSVYLAQVSLRRNPETKRLILSVYFPNLDGQRDPGYSSGTLSQLYFPAHGTARLKVATVNASDGSNPDNFAFNAVYNDGIFTPTGCSFEDADITVGSPTTYDVPHGDLTASTPTDETISGAHSIVNDAQIPIGQSFFTQSRKSVEQKSKASNIAHSDDEVNYIVLPEQTDLFTYTLAVHNGAPHSMERIVLIDNLPEIGDHYTFKVDHDRRSEFGVNFAPDPNVVVEVTKDNGVSYQALDSNLYTVAFSNTTTFGEDDWSGSNSSAGWGALSSSSRSFRIVITDGSGTSIPSGATLRVRFDGVIAPGPSVRSNSTAWNTFGYHYKLLGETVELESIPQKVGVRIPNNEITADFEIHKTKPVVLGGDEPGGGVDSPTGSGAGAGSGSDASSGTVAVEPLSGAQFTLYFGDVRAVSNPDSSFIAQGPVESAVGTGVVSFVGVSPGDYTLRETLTPVGYEPVADKIVVVDTDGSITIDNVPYDPANPPEVLDPEVITLPSIPIHKVDSADSTKSLAGAKFKLYRRVSSTERMQLGGEVVVSDIGTHTFTLNNEPYRTALFSLLDDDGESVTLELEETEVPAGYVKPDKPWVITIMRDMSKSSRWVIEVKSPQNDVIAVNGTGAHAGAYDIPNTPATYTLPETGGPGELVPLLAGLALLAFAFALLRRPQA